MEDGGFKTDVLASLHLPPRELWLFNPEVDGKLPTPIDERGLVDTPTLINLMKLTVEPGYNWQSQFVDVHHLQWPDRWYPRSNQNEDSPHVFRNLAVSKVIVPRVFHNWIHRTTEPPAMPSEEVMQYRIDAQRVAIALFRSVRSAKTAARRQKLDETQFESLLTQRFDGFASTYETARQMPKEFQLIDYANHELETTADMLRIGTKLGKHAIITSATDRVKRAVAA